MKYIAYCRKSTDEKDRQVLSIEAQVAELKEFADREHLEIVDFVVEAKTAKCPGREKFAEVLKRIEKGEAGYSQHNWFEPNFRGPNIASGRAKTIFVLWRDYKSGTNSFKRVRT